MRSTRATAAIERLKVRSGHPRYAMVMVSGGLFYLVDRAQGDAALSPRLPLDDFVTFVNAFGPARPVRRSKLDDAFEAQLRRTRPEES
ncbi:hypothetical protein OVY01_11565 [Robbsia sp. Bb-Pol-6]|uniref:Prevent-host-death protein n=1 Tax=Robbsia betulipollinis TaxID=2981849 RepID=A0ABT3ZMS7_9BURK|nr:hypothetical protein [Robbsia betulipollinis]MCY0387861.1 hypothetical protein [Robbsia betulipollinis]